MEAKKKRFTLDLDLVFQRRLKVIAALKGTSMRRYCLAAIERELAKDEANGIRALPFGDEALSRLASLQDEVFQGRQVPGDSADLVREAREVMAKTQ